ncbi:adenosine deaminase [Frankia sp. CcI156]|jgi:adenosine deaminase|uniref:Adenosine deaminase n=1 Tax=Frankia casuarinae (strain DSM 45818 / CECT 9043 / HFP020203 / CcI3) TaxID=106370 RepID=Q2J4I8_FRACC|nr:MULTISPECIES: adenosine deaminase [Frankia]ABD13804.1 adenosine deaminase [Frankia casuarinae]ETA04050.1 adenosine deaminase [Frankia sp. CcI6]EYT94296.1 adenosine deaminase [Frankia casuarinae]KDA44183.1 adenosine deaminase [Frankia sp. BMG5.23]KEZ37804.1 adenosine deaminase [Frankia sp. CeD]
MRDLRSLPKGHLHLHFELGMRPSTLADLAAAAGVPTPRTTGFTEFGGFSEVIAGILPVFRRPEDFERLVDEMIIDAADEGVTYLEPSFWPYVHLGVFGSAEAAWETVLARSDQVGARYGVTVRWMAAVDRVFDSPEQAVSVARLALRYADRGIVGLGLHNDENGWPPEPFMAAFRIARDGGLLSTPHAGELDGPASVRGAIETLDADRLQHGIRAMEDPRLVDTLLERGTCLDVCPTSNLLLSVVPSMAEHPLPALLRAGVRCSINADDPLLFGPTCLEEYELCRSALGLTDEELAACARSSVESGAAPIEVRTAALAGIDAWLADAGCLDGR